MAASVVRSSIVGILAAAGLSMAGGALAKSLVVKSAGPSAKAYPPGKQLPETAKLELRAGDTVTLLGPASTRTIRGPGTFSAGGGDSGSLSANRRARFGALRSGEVAVNPSPWNLDVSRDGKACVAAAQQPTLWRPSSTDPVTLTVTGEGGRSAEVQWAAGKSTAKWPSQLPVEDGAQYQLQMEGASSVTRVEIVTLAGGAPEDVQEAAKALIDHGCDGQLQVLVGGVSKAASE